MKTPKPKPPPADLRARIVLTNGDVYELATAVALRPAALHFVDATGQEQCVEVGAVQQVSFQHEQFLVRGPTGGAVYAVTPEEYDETTHGEIVQRRLVLRAPEEGDIVKLPLARSREAHEL